MPRVRQKMERIAVGVSKKEAERGGRGRKLVPHPPPAPYFSPSLAVPFLSCAFANKRQLRLNYRELKFLVDTVLYPHARLMQKYAYFVFLPQMSTKGRLLCSWLMPYRLCSCIASYTD